MDSTQIHDVVDWIRANSDHIYKHNGRTFEDNTSAELWFRFCLNPSIVCEYTDPRRMTMSEPTVDDGCEYIFENGPLKGSQCNVAAAFQRTRCSFHDQIVFSETVRNYLRDIHDEINNDTRTISKTNGDTKLPASEPNEMEITVYRISDNLYYSTKHKLVLQYNDQRLVCLGFFSRPGATGDVSFTVRDITPLTANLIAVCDRLGITHN